MTEGFNPGRRRLVRAGVAAAGLLAAAGAAGGAVMSREDFGGRPAGERLAHMRASLNWADGAFRNLEPMVEPPSDRSQLTVMREFLLDDNPARKPAGEIPHVRTRFGGLSDDALVWLGHSGFFVRLSGVSVLIDPALNQAFPFPGFYEPFAGADVFRPEDLPAADVLLITHDHYDHLDCRTARILRSRVRRAVYPLGVGAHLEAWGREPDRITELDWMESVRLGPMMLTALPAQHFSGRTFRRNETLWAGFLLSANGFNLYHSGDTSGGGHFAAIRRAFPRIDMALLEDGQYNVDWPGVHMLPEVWRQTLGVLSPGAVLAMHNSKFCISRHPWAEPLEKALESSIATGTPLLTPLIGEPVALDPAVRAKAPRLAAPWWRSVA